MGQASSQRVDAAGATLQVAADEVAGAVSRLLGAVAVADLTVEDPPLEEVVKERFARSRDGRAGGRAARTERDDALRRPAP